MLTNHPAEKLLTSWSFARVGAMIALSVVTLGQASAGGVADLSCVRGARSFNCAAQWATAGDPYVRAVPEVLGEVPKAQAVAREQKWIKRCRPVVERDSYGVARYHYAASGCEYGLGAD